MYIRFYNLFWLFIAPKSASQSYLIFPLFLKLKQPRSMLSSLKSKLGLGEPAPPQSLPQTLVQSAQQALDEHTPTLSWKQRAIGFGICMGVGLLLSFMVCVCCWTAQGCKGARREIQRPDVQLRSRSLLCCRGAKQQLDLTFLVMHHATPAVSFLPVDIAVHQLCCALQLWVNP